MAYGTNAQIRLFYSYAREDKPLRDELEKHLSSLKRYYRLTSWYDREILAGEEWEQALDSHLESAQLILLLISPDFMNSDYAYGFEMRRALERHQEGTCIVIPILLRPTYLESTPFNHLQLLPTDARPITRWADRDEAFQDVVKNIASAIRVLLDSLRTKEEWLNDGNSFVELNRYEEAIAAYERAIRLDPSLATAYSGKGIALNALNRYEEAIAAFELAINLDPTLAIAHNGKALALNDLKIKEESSKVDKAGDIVDQPSATGHYRLSNVFIQSGTPKITFVARHDFLRLKMALEQPGRGVVIEGPSGVGKTTSVEKAIEDLKNTEVKLHIPIQRTLSARSPEDRNEIQTLRKWHSGIVIIDDFHRLDLALRRELVDYLKELADTTSTTKKLVIVGIPRTGQSLVDASFDIATRLDIFRLGQVKDLLILQMIEKGGRTPLRYCWRIARS